MHASLLQTWTWGSWVSVVQVILFVALMSALLFLFRWCSPRLESTSNASSVVCVVCCVIPLRYTSSLLLVTLTLVSTIYREVREPRSRLNQNTAPKNAGSCKLTDVRGRHSNCDVISTEPILLCWRKQVILTRNNIQTSYRLTKYKHEHISVCRLTCISTWR